MNCAVLWESDGRRSIVEIAQYLVPTGLGLHSFPVAILIRGTGMSAVGVALRCVALPSPREQIYLRRLGSRCLGLDHLHVLEDYMNDIVIVELTHY